MYSYLLWTGSEKKSPVHIFQTISTLEENVMSNSYSSRPQFEFEIHSH